MNGLSRAFVYTVCQKIIPSLKFLKFLEHGPKNLNKAIFIRLLHNICIYNWLRNFIQIWSWN